MVARRGNAPRSAGCEPVALLLSYRANEEVAPAPGNAPGFAAPAAMQLPLRVCRWRFRAVRSWLRTKRAAIAPCG